MKRLLFVIALLILFSVNFSSALAQTPTATPTPTAQEELNQLNTEVIKLYSANKLEEALPLAEKVVQRTQALLGADSEQLIAAWRNLGEIQLARKKYKAAVASFEQAAKVQETKLGANALPLAATLLRLGNAYFRDGQTDGAEKSFARALAIREAQLPANSPLIAESANLLAQFYGSLNDWNRAITLYLKALRIAEAQPDVQDSDLLDERYGCALFKAGRRTEYDKWRQGKPDDNTTPDEVINGQALKLPRPDYPDEARRLRAQGTVDVRVLLDEQGRVIHACAVTGWPQLHLTSEVAAYQSLFSPTLFKGKSVKVTGIIKYNYVAR